MNQNLNPLTVLIDFEVAVKNALEVAFPGVDVKSCYFHLTQNIYKRIKDNGLQVRYQQDNRKELSYCNAIYCIVKCSQIIAIGPKLQAYTSIYTKALN